MFVEYDKDSLNEIANSKGYVVRLGIYPNLDGCVVLTLPNKEGFHFLKSLIV